MFISTPIGALFQMLMEMVTEPFSPEDSVAMELSSVASACLLSLVVALGDTGKMLAALAAMLTAPPSLSETKVKVRKFSSGICDSGRGQLGKTCGSRLA